jgi:hypothetical protein
MVGFHGSFPNALPCRGGTTKGSPQSVKKSLPILAGQSLESLGINTALERNKTIDKKKQGKSLALVPQDVDRRVVDAFLALSLVYADTRTNLFEDLVPDPSYRFQIFHRLEGTVLLSIVNDSLGHCLSHTRQLLELFHIGLVDVDSAAFPCRSWVGITHGAQPDQEKAGNQETDPSHSSFHFLVPPSFGF